METNNLKPIIRLIPSDFDTLTQSCGASGTRQFINNRDCPIYRACKRLGMDVRDVYTYGIEFNDGTSLGIKGDIDDVERCRKNLLKGEPAYIEMIP